MKNKKRETAVYLALSALLLLADWFSKRWAETVLAAVETMPLLEGIVSLRYAENTGAAFSALSGSTVLLTVFSLAVCAVILFYLIRHPELGALSKLSLSMVFAGGVGNLIDRITRGYVVDFFELQFIEFAIFNVADICITVGAALLFIALLRGGEDNARMEN